MLKNLKQLFIIPVVLFIGLFVAIFDGLKRLFKDMGDYLMDIAMK